MSIYLSKVHLVNSKSRSPITKEIIEEVISSRLNLNDRTMRLATRIKRIPVITVIVNLDRLMELLD